MIEFRSSPFRPLLAGFSEDGMYPCDGVKGQTVYNLFQLAAEGRPVITFTMKRAVSSLEKPEILTFEADQSDDRLGN